MDSTKREPRKADTEEPESKRAKLTVAESSEPRKTKPLVVLNPADCDLDFNIEPNGLHGSAFYEDGFAYCWSGARANVGITGGKYCFSCKIIAAQPVVMEDTPVDQQHLCRLGISRGDNSLGNLGETEHSFGYGGTGKFSNAGMLSDYGEKYGIGDAILCTVNLENKSSAFIAFSKNGKSLGTAKHFDAGSNGLGVVDSPALFPHVLLKNVVVQVQFSVDDGLVPQEGYKPWAFALEDGNAIMGPTFTNPRDCEVMMMVGLPASGKSTWAEKWVKEHPEKRYILLGTNLALDQMKVPGLLHKRNYGERFERLMDLATGIFNTLLSRASQTPRNFIIDQTNVYKSARKRKLKAFANYLKIAVVVFPRPEEHKVRAEKRFREMGKEVSLETVKELFANFVLHMSKDMPGADECFDQVMFPELNRAESQRHLDEMKCVLGSINSNSKSNLPPCSRESYVQSYNTPYSRGSSISFDIPSMQSQGTLGVTGNWLSSHPPQPPSSNNYHNHGQGSSSYLGAGPPGRIESFSGEYQSTQNPPALSDSPYGKYSSTDSYLSRTDFNHYKTYGRYGAGDPYSHPSVEGRNFIPGGAADPYHSGSYGCTFGGHISVSREPPADLQVPSQPTFPGPPPPPYAGSADLPTIPIKCQNKMIGLAWSPIDVNNLLTEAGGYVTSFTPQIVLPAPILPSIFPGPAMTPRKDLATLAAKEAALGAKAAGKRRRRRRHFAVGEGQELRRLRRGPADPPVGGADIPVGIAAVLAPASAEIPVGVSIPEVVRGNTPVPAQPGKGTSRSAESPRNRIWAALVPENIHRFEGLLPQEIVGWIYSFADSIDCLAAGVEFQLASLTKKAADAEAALVAEREKAKEAGRELEIARTIVANKKKELEKAIRAKLKAQEVATEAQAELEVARAELVASQSEGKALAEVAAARAKVEKNAEEEFEAGFFQGYIDLKRRVALDHPEWDLTAYSGAASDFWEEFSAVEEVGETDVVVVDPSA